MEKHNRYSNWEAIIESSATDDESALQHDEVKGKRRLSRIFRKLPFRPTLRFLYVYFWQKVFWMVGQAMCLPGFMPSMNSFLVAKAKAI